MMQPHAHTHRRQLSEEVADYLRDRIITGELEGGHQIRAEEVGAILDVSTTPVREALQALKAQGLLDATPHKGYSVAAVSSDDIRDLFEGHALIAGELCARAAVRGTPHEKQDLASDFFALVESAHETDLEDLELKNHLFHVRLYCMARSERLRWSIGMLTHYVPRHYFVQVPGWTDHTLEVHGAILKAVERSDGEAAREIMGEHVRHSGEQLAQYIDDSRARVADRRAAEELDCDEAGEEFASYIDADLMAFSRR